MINVVKCLIEVDKVEHPLSIAACQWCGISTSAWVVEHPFSLPNCLDPVCQQPPPESNHPQSPSDACWLWISLRLVRDHCQIVNGRRQINFHQKQYICHHPENPDIRHVNFSLQISRKLPIVHELWEHVNTNDRERRVLQLKHKPETLAYTSLLTSVV